MSHPIPGQEYEEVDLLGFEIDPYYLQDLDMEQIRERLEGAKRRGIPFNDYCDPDYGYEQEANV